MPQELKLTSLSSAQIAKIFKQCLFFFFSVLVEQRTRPNTDVQLILESRLEFHAHQSKSCGRPQVNFQKEQFS